MPVIKKIDCHKILNSRGDWTIETHVSLSDDSLGVQTIPEGASKGENEAVSIPVEKAVEVVSTAINDAFVGEDPFDQRKIDEQLISMDGTPNKKHLGGNSILSVSLAIARAVSQSRNLELYAYIADLYGFPLTKSTLKYPTPVFNILNGGKHAHNNLSFQEFMVIPTMGLPISDAIEMGAKIYHALERILSENGYDTDVGDEGGFAPNNLTVPQALQFIKMAAAETYKVGQEVFFGLDVAAGSFYSKDKYYLKEEDLLLGNEELINYFANLLKEYELVYIEDPLYERDYIGWKMFYKNFGAKLMVVADDLVVTNPKFLKKAIEDKLTNAVIVKPNQIGTLTETLDFIKMAKSASMSTIVSHRSGDTAEDTFIADLSLGAGADFMKAGAPVRGERVAKYNRLLEVFSN